MPALGSPVALEETLGPGSKVSADAERPMDVRVRSGIRLAPAVTVDHVVAGVPSPLFWDALSSAEGTRRALGTNAGAASARLTACSGSISKVEVNRVNGRLRL